MISALTGISHEKLQVSPILVSPSLMEVTDYDDIIELGIPSLGKLRNVCPRSGPYVPIHCASYMERRHGAQMGHRYGVLDWGRRAHLSSIFNRDVFACH